MTCDNCEIEIDEIDDGTCPACRWLLKCAEFPHPHWDSGLKELARCAPVSRRWQFRFWRGELSE